MSSATLSIEGENFLIGGVPTYSEIPDSPATVHGLLMNARFVQGVFDDRAAPERFARFGRETWDPEYNTDRLIAALPEWYGVGLRAFTVCFQGGGPVFTTPNDSIDNNPFGADGTALDPAYAARMHRLITAAADVGMVVIVSYLYQGQVERLEDGRAIRNAVTTGSRFLRAGGYDNVIVEVVNEHDVGNFAGHPIVYSGEGMAALIDLARRESGGLPVGCSGGGGSVTRDVVEASDVVLVHGNGLSRQQYANMIMRARRWAPGKPVVCNEDSQAIARIPVAVATRSSWGYYNNMTKQEPPADWSITPGEDRFFATRVSAAVGIPVDIPPIKERFRLQGLEPWSEYEGKRWIRLAALYSETVDRVDFYRNGHLYYTAWDEPFLVHQRGTWIQGPVTVDPSDKDWRAVVHLADGTEIEETYEHT